MGLFTRVQLTTDSSPRTRPVGGVVLHHAAMTGSVEALVSMMMPGGRTVSAHAAIKDDEIVNTVQLNQRAWSLGDAYWDSWACTAECVNDSVNGWTLSARTHESIARFVAAMANRFGFHPHRNGDPKTWTVLGQREVYTIHGGSYATACPGGMDLAWITRRAQQLLGGSGVPADLGEGQGQSAEPTYAGYPIRKIQQLLTEKGFSTAVDGIYGPDTERQVRAFQKSVGLTADGDVGPATWAALNAGTIVTDIPEGEDSMFTAIVNYKNIKNKVFLVLPTPGAGKPFTAIPTEGGAKLPEITYPVTSEWALKRLQSIADGVE